MLVIFSGLPGAGKTAIARELARQIGAVYLRIDSIEEAIRASCLGGAPIDDAGYRVAYAVAEDNLRIGRTVIADSVNPLQITRDAWREVAARAGAVAVEVEARCSDAQEHRRRVETRMSWDEVVSRRYEPWDREHIVIDTAEATVEENVALLTRLVAPATPLAPGA